MQGFLETFIKEFFHLFDTRGRSELHACYHELCMFSMCVVSTEDSIVPTRQYKYGALLYDSRNLKKVKDDTKRISLLRHGKTAVLDFLRVKFPLTKHEGNSFHVDVMSTTVSVNCSQMAERVKRSSFVGQSGYVHGQWPLQRW